MPEDATEEMRLLREELRRQRRPRLRPMFVGPDAPEPARPRYCQSCGAWSRDPALVARHGGLHRELASSGGTKVCPTCNGIFEPKREDQAYCGRRCKDRDR